MRPSLSTLTALLLPIVAAGCAPARQDIVPEEPENTLATALFVELLTGEWSGYSQADLYLVDDPDFTCEDLAYGYELDVWSLDPEVAWVTTSAYLGENIGGGWEQEFRSMEAFTQEVGLDYSVADFFYGAVGHGGEEAVPGSAEERSEEGRLGQSEEGLDDLLTFDAVSSEGVTGTLETQLGTWHFSGVHCGEVEPAWDGR